MSQSAPFWCPTASVSKADRIFVGAAESYDGNFRGSGWQYTWLDQAWQFPIVQNSAVAVVNGENDPLQAITGATASTNAVPATSQTPIALSGYALNNATAPASVGAVWGAYLEGRRAAGAGVTFGAEIDVCNLGDCPSPNPWQEPPNATVGAWLASGGGVAGANPAMAALGICANPAPWATGLLFQHNAIEGTDGSNGLGTAILMATRQVIGWAKADGQQVAQIYALTTQQVNFQVAVFSDYGFYIGGMSGPHFLVPPIQDATNFLQVNAGAPGQPVALYATGQDANVSLVLAPKGGGVVWSTTGIVQASDPSLKTDVAPMPDTLDLVGELEPVTFRWKEGDGRTHWGFLAPDVAATFQARGLEFGGHVKERDLEGLRVDQLTAVLCKAVQELAARASSLAARTNLAEEKLAKLESRILKLEGAG